MPSATQHIVFGYEVEDELAAFLAGNAVSSLGTYKGQGTGLYVIRTGRVAPTPLKQIAIRGENGQRGYLSYPRVHIWVQDATVAACKVAVAQIYELLDHKRPALATIRAFFKADASDENIRQNQNYVRFPIGFQVTCHPNLGVAPTVVPAP